MIVGAPHAVAVAWVCVLHKLAGPGVCAAACAAACAAVVAVPVSEVVCFVSVILVVAAAEEYVQHLLVVAVTNYRMTVVGVSAEAVFLSVGPRGDIDRLCAVPRGIAVDGRLVCPSPVMKKMLHIHIVLRCMYYTVTSFPFLSRGESQLPLPPCLPQESCLPQFPLPSGLPQP